MKDEKLYVITVISNPRRFDSRYNLYKKFEKYVADSGAQLVTVEQAFGERPFEITDAENPFHIRVRSRHELWHKENMVNIAMSRLPLDWKYVAWVDADVTFARPDWVSETLHMLQHHHVVQMFSRAQDLSPTFEPFNNRVGFIAHWQATGEFMDTSGAHVGKVGPNGDYFKFTDSHPGYAWAATRHAIDSVGGLFEHAILGAGDHHMACALIGKVEGSIPKGLHQNYKHMLELWAKRAKKLALNIGHVPGLVNHHWHGKKKDRRYNDRWKVLIDNQYDPVFDVMKDSQGLLQFAHEEKPRLRDGCRNYFAARNEDSTDME